jgi:hypothetical protein
MRATRLIMVGAAAAMLAGCTPEFARQDDSAVILRVTSVTTSTGGTTGATGGSGLGSVLLSDVRSDTGSVFNDNATISVESIAKNQNGPTLGTFNDVILEQYTVRFIRTDGLSREGVDVPYSFDGPLDLIVPVNGTSTAPILIVRHAAKLEPPLANLVNQGGIDLLTTIAEITLYGHTTSGKAVSTVARLEVHFADFGG